MSIETWTEDVATRVKAKDDMKLCYVQGMKAFFTSAPLDQQTGDDWNDAPYEHNAGSPYCRGATIQVVLFEANMETPADIAGCNSPYSVDDINAHKVAWLAPSRWGSGQGEPIFAGISIAEFKRLIRQAGGAIYKVDED